MHAEFAVSTCFGLPDLGVVVSGKVIDGQIEDGSQGTTPKGKIFAVVKMDMRGEPVHTARVKDMVTLFIKNVTIFDIKPGATLYSY